MALSEHERRNLQALEQQLRKQDPKLAAALSTRPGSRPWTKPHPAYGAGAVAVGTVLLIAGFFTTAVVSLTGVVAISAGLTLLVLRRLAASDRLWAVLGGFGPYRRPRQPPRR